MTVPTAETSAHDMRKADTSAVRGAATRKALQPFNGLRVLSAIHIMVFHHMLLREFSSEELNSAFRKRPAVFGAILNGNLGLDTLFLISGFLAALVLIPALEQPRGSTWQEVLRYWYRRVVRIAPAHWASLVVTYAFMLRGRHAPMPREAAAALAHYPVASCPAGLWTQAAFLGHWHMTAGCGLQLWSQGLQAAFWLWVPVLLAAARPQRAGFRRRAAMMAGGVIAASTAYRAWLDWRADVRLPIVAFGSPDMAELLDFVKYLDVHHSGLAMRAASLAVGGLAALPFLDPHSFQHPASGARGVNGDSQKAVAISIMSHKTALIGTNVAAVIVAVLYSLSYFKPAGAPVWPRAISLPFLVTMLQGGAISSAAIVFLMTVAMTRAGPAGRLLHAVLAAPLWKPLAELSYSAYLYHEPARFWVWRYRVLPTGYAKSADDLGAFAVDMAVSVAATFAVAFVSHRLIERPAAKFGARLEPLLFGSPAAKVKPASAAASVTANTASGAAAPAA